MPTFVLDTSYLIAYKIEESLQDKRCVFSEVVLLELIGSASDKSTFEGLRLIRDLYAKDKNLITVSSEDWELAGKVLYFLEQNVRSHYKGKAQKKISGASQRMALDALIAVSARRFGATVITENLDDYERIAHYLKKLHVMSGEKYRKNVLKLTS